MPYRCNINYVLSQDQNSGLSINLLSQIILYVFNFAAIYLASSVAVFYVD